jgi:hypothetical protein
MIAEKHKLFFSWCVVPKAKKVPTSCSHGTGFAITFNHTVLQRHKLCLAELLKDSF